MKPSPGQSRRLRIEALETRTLLAGAADPFGLVADYDATMQAVSGQGDFTASFGTNFGNHQLLLTGTSDATLTIDLDKLPDFITNLKISGFASVNLVGKDTVENLILTDVDAFIAPNMAVTGQVLATNVDVLKLGRIGAEGGASYGQESFLRLNGTRSEIDVGEFGDNTTVLLNLESLTLSTLDDTFAFINVHAGDEPYIYLKDYVRGHLKVDPDGMIDFSRIRDWTAPVVTPDDPTTPTDPVTPTDPGTPTDPVTPEPPTDPHEPGFVIVDLPLDERMRAFVMELRSLLASSSGDIDELVAQYMAQHEQANPAVVAEGAGHLGALIHSDTPGHADTLPPTPSIPGLVAPGGDGLHGVVLPDDLRSFGVSPEKPAIALQEFDIHFSAIGPLELARDGVVTAFPAIKELKQDEHATRPVENDPTLAESVQALGSYIAERVAAEFTPGQQSFVLLVDPPPPRGLTTAKKALVDRAAATAPVGLTSPAPELA